MPSLTRLAIAAVALIAAIGGAVYFIGPSQGPAAVGPTERPTATPTASQPADAGTLVYEIKLPADTIPSWEGVTLALADVTIAAHTEAVWTASAGACCPGPNIRFIVEGTLKVVSEGPMEVIRAGASSETISAGTEIVLEPGDTVTTRNEIGDTWTNVGPGAVELIGMDVLSGLILTPPVPDGWAVQGADRRDGASLQAGGQVLQLRRVKVASDEELSPPPAGHRLAVISGEAGVFFSSSADGTLRVRGTPNQSADAYILTYEPG